MDITVLQVAVLAATTTVIVASLQFVARWLESRRPQKSNALHASRVEERLARIEQVVETTALEVERISEANRFLAKVIAERVAAPLPRGATGRAVTPH